MLLLLKIALAPALVVAASLGVRRWGTAVGGLIATLPVVAGPIMLIIALDHGERFGAHVARGALLGLLGYSAWAVTFARCAPWGRWTAAIAAGWLAYFAVAGALYRWDVSAPVGLALAFVASSAARAALREPPAGARPSVPPSWDLWARAGATAILVVSLTSAAQALGPALSGVLSPFPIAASVLTAFTLAHDGPDAGVALARALLLGLYSFAIFIFCVAVLIEPIGTGPAFAVALAAACTVQAAVHLGQGAVTARAERR